MKQKIFNVLSTLLIIILGTIVVYYHTKKVESTEYDIKEVVRLEQPEFFLSEYPDKKLLMDALKYYDIQNPEIVCAQAILETGYFKSRVCRKYNNLFGLYDSKNKDYYKFNHWSDSVLGYLNYIQYKYHPPDDYYVFLQEIGYAEDSLYISKLKKIVNLNE